MGSKNKKQMKGDNGGEEKAKGSSGFAADPMISDPRFSSAHTDPRFRRLPRREAKVTLDSRFQSVLTDTASAPVDKRGKKRRKGSGKDSLKEYYRIEDEDKKKMKKKDESESESEQEMMKALKAEAKRRKSEVESSEEDEKSEEESKTEKLKLASSSDEESDEKSESEEVSEEEEEDTDEDDEAMYEEEDGFEIPEEEITNIDKETHRLAIVNMDWRHVSAKDLYVVFTSFLPKDGRIVSVSVYPSEFGLERMKEEEIHGPKIDIDKKNNNEDEDDKKNNNEEEGEDDEDEEEDEDEEVINQKLRAYEISRLKYYFAVVECDSVATADFLYKSCDGIEFERSSNKLDLRFIPDSMEFKHPPRDTATQAPSNYKGLEFQSQALQMSKVNLSWDDDEPHRVKTLNQKFKDDQLAALEMKEYIASSDDDESESDDDANKKETGKEKYRALLESNKDNDEEEDEEDNEKSDEGMDMEVTFNTRLEDLSKQVREKKDQKESESVWDKYLRERREKKRAKKKNKKNNDDSSDDDYNTDNRKSVKEDGDDDFFMEEPKPLKKKKTKKEEVAVEEERSRAELELLLADENDGGEGLKGYNIKKKGNKKAEDEKILPAAELDDSRFAAILSDPLYALDPTDPQFKRSATYVRQLAQKQKEVPKSHEEVEAKPEETKKERRHEMSSTIKSVKMKSLQHKDSDKKMKAGGNAESTLAKIKKKVKDLSRK